MMGTDGTMIVSPEALTKLMEAMQRYRWNTSTAITDVATDLSRRLRRLEAVREEAQREAWRCGRGLSECDEGDNSRRARAELDDAQERLSKAEYWIEQVADALPQFKRVNHEAQALFESLGFRKTMVEMTRD